MGGRDCLASHAAQLSLAPRGATFSRRTLFGRRHVGAQPHPPILKGGCRGRRNRWGSAMSSKGRVVRCLRRSTRRRLVGPYCSPTSRGCGVVGGVGSCTLGRRQYWCDTYYVFQPLGLSRTVQPSPSRPRTSPIPSRSSVPSLHAPPSHSPPISSSHHKRFAATPVLVCAVYRVRWWRPTLPCGDPSTRRYTLRPPPKSEDTGGGTPNRVY